MLTEKCKCGGIIITNEEYIDDGAGNEGILTTEYCSVCKKKKVYGEEE